MRQPRSLFDRLELTKPKHVTRYPVFNDQYRVQHDSFSAMLRAALNNSSHFRVEKVIREWWLIAFEDYSGFPEEGITLEEASLMIQYKLMGDGAAQYDYELSDKFWQNHQAALERRPSKLSERMRDVLECLKLSSERQQIISYPQSMEDEEMAKVTPKAKAKAKPVQKKPAAKKKMSNEQVGDRIYALLLERKHTDREIIQIVNSESGTSNKTGRVRTTRDWINKNAKDWPELKKFVKSPLEEISEDETSEELEEKEDVTPDEEATPETHEAARVPREAKARIPRGKK